MFGSSTTGTTTPAFGSSSSAFGSTSSTSAFGRSTTSAFGGGSSPFGGGGSGVGTQSAFGTTTTTTPSPFGMIAPQQQQQQQQQQSPGIFGQSHQQQQQIPSSSSAFGGSTSFGVSAAPTPFTFGSPPQQQQPSIFGSSNPTATTSTTSPFGGTPSTSLFGSTTTSSSPFAPAGTAPSSTAFGGVPASGGLLFGGSSTTTTAPLFGGASTAATPTSTNLFGGGATSTAPTSFFGGASPSATTTTSTTTGTLAVPYSVTRKQDGQTTVTMKAITAMPAYEHKSFEELRFEDYMAGNRGTATATPATMGGFTGGGFGTTVSFGMPTPTPQPQQPQSLFGTSTPSSGAFFGGGSTTTTSLLPTSTATFGSTSMPFGTTATAPTGGAFGFGSPTGAAPAPASGFSFGTAAPAPSPSAFTFGSTTAGAPTPSSTTGLFGSSVPTSTTGGLFGTTSTAPAPSSLFGTTTTTPAPGGGGGLFGGGGGLFGSSTVSSATAPSTSSGGGFFASTTSPQPAFGSTTGFGASAPAPTTTTTTFGGGGGLFGSSSTAPAPATTTTGLFGTSTAAPSSSLGGGFFGSTTAAASPSPSTGLFGATTAGTTTTPAFGAPPSSTTGFFGGTTTTPSAAPAGFGGGLFGSSSIPAPSSTSTTSAGLFGSAPSSTTTSGLFGSSLMAPTASAPSSLFGSAGGGLFGTTTAATTMTTPNAWGGGVSTPALGTTTGESLLAQRLAAIEEQKRELAMLESWSGGGGGSSGSPLTAGTSRNGYGIILPASLVERPFSSTAGVSSPPPTAADILHLRSSATAAVAPRSTTRIRPRGFFSSTTQVRTPPELMKQLGDVSSSPIVSPGMALFGSSATKRLVIQPGSLSKSAAKPKVRLQLTNGDTTSHPPTLNGIREKEVGGEEHEMGSGTATTRRATGTIALDSSSQVRDISSIPHHVTPRRIHEVEEESVGKHADVSFTLKSPTPERTSTVFSPTPPTTADTSNNNKSFDLYKRVIASPGDVKSPAAAIATAPPSELTDVVPKLTKAGYIVSPTLDRLAKLSEADLAAVSHFVVSRPGYGSVAWEGAVDVRGVDLDIVVAIEDKEVAVYDEYEENTGYAKPPVGSKLNRPAIITLEHVFPSDRSNPEAIQKFERKVTKQTAKMGAHLISYDASSGVWKFRTHHFSRYGLVADDDDDSDEEDITKSTISAPQLPPASLGTNQKTALLSLIPGNEAVVHEAAFYNIPDQHHKLPLTRFVVWDDIEDMETEDDENVIVMKRQNATGSSSSNAQRIKLDAADTAYLLIISEAERLEQALQSSRSQAMLDRVSKICQGEAYLSDDIIQVREKTKLTSAVKVSDISALKREIDSNRDEAIIHRKVTDISSLLRTADFRSNGGISAQIASACNITTFTSSKIDFGMRMGRSFHVAWKPDGSFLQPDPDFYHRANVSTRLRIKRPDFREDSANYDLKSLLKVHWKNSVQLVSVLNCPIYTLPSIMDNGKASCKALCQAIEEYAAVAKSAHQRNGSGSIKDPELGLVAQRAFSLLCALYGQETESFDKPEASLLPVPSIHSSTNLLNSERRRQGLLSWLREACAFTTKQKVSSTKNNDDDSTAIFLAMSGGDMNLACSLATERKLLRLSILLSMFDCTDEFRDLMREQLQQWGSSGFDTSMSLSMKRIYSLLSGSLEMERQLHDSLDWRRRLCLHLLFTCGTDMSVEDAIREYDSDVSAALAPYPVPRYNEDRKSCNSDLDPPRCILYNLLCMRVDGGGRYSDIGVSIATALSPLGYTSARHDLSLSFHISACIRALHCAPDLSPFEISVLKESFCAQLICDGLWHWAVYAMLCSGGALDTYEYAVKSAKNIILQHYQEKDEPRRHLLENEMNVPSIWFEQALAVRCGFEGKEIDHIRHLIACSQLDEACRATEELIMPRAFLNGGEEANRLLSFLRVLKEESDMELTSSRWCSINGCGAFLQLLELSEHVTKLELGLRAQGDSPNATAVTSHDEARELVLMVDELCKLFVMPDSNETVTEYWACRPSSNYAQKDCMRTVAILSACNRLSILHLQLNSILLDIPVRVREEDFTLRSRIII